MIERESMAAAAAADYQLIKFSLFLAISLLNSVATQSVPPTEWRALLHLRSSLGISSKNWHKKANPCLNWTGIHCQYGHVTAITLSGLTLTRNYTHNPRFAVDSLPNFPLLSTFNSSGFLLSGQIPDWFGSKLSNLQVLDLSSSSISGSIPSSLASLSKLKCLNLSNNSITGNIPTALEKLQNSLTVLDLSQNSFTGQIPLEISSLRNLTILDLSSNYLSGAIPLDFSFISKLEQMNLSRNSLSSSIPAQIANLSKMEHLDLGFNSLSGALPQELGGLKNLKLLDVSRNNLTGVFPNQTASSFNVTGAVLNFSDNLFYGNLTSGFGNASVVDLSSNYFVGEPPKGARFRLSNNCFSSLQNQRKIPRCSKFYKDVGVPYGNDSSTQPMQPPSVQRSKRKSSRLPYVMIGVFGGFGLVLIVTTALLLLLRSCKARSTNQQAQGTTIGAGDVEQPPKFTAGLSCLGVGEPFTFEQLLKATSNFSAENLIKEGHSGWLFRAVLEGGELAVVKKVDLHAVRRECFVSEVELLSKAGAHQRLLPLIGHCFEDENVKFLVYKYMPNGDLSNALYRMTSSEEGLQSLDWITRLKIAIGAAEALSYLHNECTPPVVHRDIQASSILLDNKYEVRLGSFSEACASGATNHQSMVSRLLWTPQTSGRRPSGSSSATCAYDVYCFGKVLLELVSGKLGTSKLNDSDAKQWLDNSLQFISIYEKEMVNKIVDQSLIIDEDMMEEVWAVAVVAKSCLNPKASRRPSMRHVVRALENPFKVVRDENFSSGRLRTMSSRQSWTAALFGSWHHTSSDSSNMSAQTNKEIIGGLRQTERVESRGSGTNDHSSSHKRSSSDVFPEPVEMQDVESAN